MTKTWCHGNKGQSGAGKLTYRECQTDMASFFRENLYVCVWSLITGSRLTELYSYALAEARSGRLRGDMQVPGTPAAYGDVMMENLLKSLRPSIQRATGLELYPTYSYFRVYKKGDILKQHTDRFACEISVTLCIGFQADAPWPIWIMANNAELPIDLEPGDALIYRGIEVPHWRTPFNGVDAAQVFLHYVDKNGPHSGFKYDHRPSLNTNA